jgi:deoxycytidylate deaminase
MSRIKRGIRSAIKAALKSNHGKFRVGSAILKGSSVISTGYNCRKTNPNSNTRYFSQHGELRCLLSASGIDIAGSDIFVARVTPGGRLGMARPCEKCLEVLRKAGIRRAIYTDQSGNIRIEAISQVVPISS